MCTDRRPASNCSDVLSSLHDTGSLMEREGVESRGRHAWNIDIAPIFRAWVARVTRWPDDLTGRAFGWHIFALVALALAAPIYELLGKNAAFFVVRGSQPIDLLAFTGAISLAVPLALCLAVLAAKRVSKRLGWVALLGAIAACVMFIALQPLRKWESVPGTQVLVLAGSISLLAALFYASSKSARSVLTVLGPVAIIFPAYFLILTPVRKVLLPPAYVSGATGAGQPATTPPIVLILVDELPVTTLMDAEKQIDRRRFPHLSEFASSATWYRSTLTPGIQTISAIPAILTGTQPEELRLPTGAEYPNNIFSLLKDWYKFNANESATALCPVSLSATQPGGGEFRVRLQSLADDSLVILKHLVYPQQYAVDLPSVQNRWGDFNASGNRLNAFDTDMDATRSWRKMADHHVAAVLGLERRTIFDRFMTNLGKEADSASFHFVHLMLPHQPWDLLPTGTRYRVWADLPGFQLVDDRWTGSPEIGEVQYQAHILQAAYVDRLLGEVFDELKRKGWYDESLVIVAADHGVTFKTGLPSRNLHADNAGDLLWVPLLVKYPGQSSGTVVDETRSVLDIVPTIADVIGLELTWKTDGSSLLQPLAEPIRNARTLDPAGTLHTLDLTTLSDQRGATLRRLVERFSLDSTSTDHFRFGRYASLIGKTIQGLELRDGGPQLSLRQPSIFKAVVPESGYVPSLINGTLQGMPEEFDEFMVAVNGVVRATARVGRVDGEWAFSCIVPEESFRKGSNRIDGFWVSGPAESPRILRATQPDNRDFRIAGNYLVTPDHERIPITRRTRGGAVDQLKQVNNLVAVSGWGGNPAAGRPADKILAFADGDMLSQSKPRFERPDLAQRHHLDEPFIAGFRMLLESALMDGKDVRFVAVMGDQAVELPTGLVQASDGTYEIQESKVETESAGRP